MMQFKALQFSGNVPFTVYVVPILQDNYSYLIKQDGSERCWVIDPAEPKIILEALEQINGHLVAIATTHHHDDHAGGNVELTKRFPGLRVYGFDERIPSLTNKVIDEEIIHIDDLDVKVIHTPCHTSGSVCFAVMNDDRHMAVFTGDTLFLGGCGRFFEGSAKEMVESLHVKLGQLPPEISIFPGHEYTLSNLKFALHVEPQNENIKERIALLQNGPKCTIPGSLAEEWKTNPFMRLSEPSIIQVTGQIEPIQVMQVLRSMKNNFTL